MDFHPLTKFSEIPLVSCVYEEYNKENLRFLEEMDMLLYGILLLSVAFAALAGFSGLGALAVLGSFVGSLRGGGYFQAPGA